MAVFSASFLKRFISGLFLSIISFCIVWKGGWPFVIFLALWGLTAFVEWVQLSLKSKKKNRRLFFLLCGIFYVPLSFLSLYHLREDFPIVYGLAFAFMVVFSDIGAYAFGKSIGGAKMASEISPNKTWAGFAGSMICPAVIGSVFSYIATQGFAFVPAFAALGVLIGFVSQSGDLLVSYLKRRAGVKDTGGIIPGHGGVLDRIDSMMLAAPVVFFIFAKVGHVFGL